jgi:hypothetical protein
MIEFDFKEKGIDILTNFTNAVLHNQYNIISKK